MWSQVQGEDALLHAATRLDVRSLMFGPPSFSQDAGMTLLEARRQDFASLKATLPSIVRNSDALKQIATLSPDEIQIFMRSLQRVSRVSTLMEIQSQ